MNQIKPTAIKSVTGNTTLMGSLLNNALTEIPASAQATGANRGGFSDFAGYAASIYKGAEKLATALPGFDPESLAQLLQKAGHQAGVDSKKAPETTQSQIGSRDDFGDLPPAVKALADAPAKFTEQEKAAAQKAQEDKIKAGNLLLIDGEHLDAKAVNMHDFTQLERNFGANSKFSKNTDGSLKLDLGGNKTATFNDQQFKDLLAGKPVEIGTGPDKKTFSYDSKTGNLIFKGSDNKEVAVSDHRLDKMTFGSSGLNAEGHRIANSRLGYLAEGNGKDGAAKLDEVLKQVKDALKDSPLANDAHTLSYLAGKFAKLDNGQLTLDKAALTTALNDTKFTEQLAADKATRGKSITKDQAVTENKANYDATQSLFANGLDLKKAAEAQGFKGGSEHRTMAGSAELASNKAYSDLTAKEGEKPAFLAKLEAAAAGATQNNPIKLSFNFMGTSSADADTNKAYNDSSRGADGGLSTLMTLNGPLAGKVNEIQLGSAGYEGLKNNLTAVKDFLKLPETQTLIDSGKLQVEGLALALHAHGNDTLIALGGDDNLDATKLKEVSDLMNQIYDACGTTKPSEIGVTFNSCQGFGLAQGVAKDIFTHAGPNYAGRVTADGTKGFTKLSGNDAARDDAISQFIATSSGSVIRKDRYSNDGTSYTHGGNTLESSTDREVFQNSALRTQAANTSGVAGLITQGDRTDVGREQIQANQAASNAGGSKPPTDPKEPKRDGAGCLDPQESPANDEWKKQTSAVS
jgi:hypothetical protein